MQRRLSIGIRALAIGRPFVPCSPDAGNMTLRASGEITDFTGPVGELALAAESEGAPKLLKGVAEILRK